MGKILIPGGSGADVSVVTATADDVVSPKVIVDKNGVPLTGDIPPRTSSSPSISNNVITIPRGYYPSEFSKTIGTAQAAQTITPGTSNKTIAAGKYLTGTQTITGDADLVAGNIKKGVNIFGVAGSFEGWVPGTKDIYKNGSWGSGYSSGQLVSKPYTRTTGGPTLTFQTAQILVKSVSTQVGGFCINKAISLAPYNSINVEFSTTVGAGTMDLKIYSTVPTCIGASADLIKSISYDVVDTSHHTLSLSLSGISNTAYILFGYTGTRDYNIHRIYFT